MAGDEEGREQERISGNARAFKRLKPFDAEAEMGGFHVPIPLGPNDANTFRYASLASA